MNNRMTFSRNKSIGTQTLALVLLLPLWAGCVYANNRARTGPLLTETQTIETKGATTASIDLDMGAGELTLGGGASELANATFNYNVDVWKPIVNYSVTNGTGTLTMRQPDIGLSTLSSTRNDWDVHLNNTLPLALKVHLGAGKSTLNLGNMALTALDVECGAGETMVDLSGAWTKNTDIKIDGGVGQLTVRLPKEVGVRIKADTGIGTVKHIGLAQDGDVFTNAAYGTSPITLNIDISAGVGEVRLELMN